MRTLSLFLLFFGITFHVQVFAEESLADSIHRVLPKMADDTNKVLLLNRFSDRHGRLGNYDSSIFYGEKAAALSAQLHYTLGTAAAYNNIGVAYWYSGNYQRSFKALFTSLSLYEKTGNKKGIASELNNIGIVYANQDNYPKALEYYIRTLKIKTEIGDKKGISSTLLNIGVVFEHDSDYAKAMNYYKQSLAIKKEINEKKGIATCLNNMALVYSSEKKNDSALIYFQESLKIREELNDKTGVATTSDNIANIYLLEKKYAEAEKLLLAGKKITLEMKNYELTVRNRSVLVDLYKKTGRWELAFEALEEAQSANDSLNILSSKKEADKQEMKYQFEKEKLSLEKAQELKNTVAAEDKKKQTIILIAVSAVLALVLVFSVFLFGRFRITQRQKILIQRQKEIVDDKNKEVFDSIHYAKRIQQSLLPTEKYIERNFKRLNK